MSEKKGIQWECFPSSLFLLETSVNGFSTETVLNTLLRESSGETGRKNSNTNWIVIRTERKELNRFNEENEEKYFLDLEKEDDFDVSRLLDRVRSLVGTRPGPWGIVVDTLTPISLHNSLSRVIKFLSALQNLDLVHTVIVVILSKCHEILELDLIRESAQTVLNLEPTEENRLVRGNLRHRRDGGGKSWCKCLNFSVNNLTGELSQVQNEKKTLLLLKEIEKEMEEESSSKMMNSLTTFNLTLNEKEKAARDKVVMPFWKENSSSNPNSKKKIEEEENEDLEEESSVRINSKKNNHGVAKIYYDPDEADDWDDEDPDDDLDF